MRSFFPAAVAVALIAASGPAFAQSGAAVPSCRSGDPVVWVNTGSNVYHMQGSKYYGNTKAGKYECQSQANAAGAHQAKNEGGKPASAASPRPGATRSTAGATAPAAGAAAGAANAAATPAVRYTPVPHPSASAGSMAAPMASASPSGKRHRKSHASPSPAASGAAAPAAAGAAAPSPSPSSHHSRKKKTATPSPAAT